MYSCLSKKYSLWHCSFQWHYDKLVYDAEVGKMKEQCGGCLVERGRSRDTTAVTGVRDAVIDAGTYRCPIGSAGWCPEAWSVCSLNPPASCSAAKFPWLWVMTGCPRYRRGRFLDQSSLKGLHGPFSQGLCWYWWSVLLPQALMKPEVNVDVCGVCCHLKTFWCLWSMLWMQAMFASLILQQQGVVLTSEAHVTTEGHVDVHCLCNCLKHCLLTSMSLSPQRAMLMFVSSVFTWGHVDIHGSSCCWELCLGHGPDVAGGVLMNIGHVTT